MEHYRTIIIAAVIVLPVAVTFGLSFVRSLVNFNRKHHLIAIEDISRCSYLPNEKNMLEDELKRFNDYENDKENYSHYVNERYC